MRTTNLATARSHRNLKHRHGPFAISAPTARETQRDQARRAYHFTTAETIEAYRKQQSRADLDHGYAWLDEYLDLWARWHAGEFHSGLGGGGGMLPAYNENHDMPRCTVSDINGTAFDQLMLDIEAAYTKLPGMLQQPVLYFYRKDMGRAASAQACNLSEKGFDGRLKLAYYHIARMLNGQ